MWVVDTAASEVNLKSSGPAAFHQLFPTQLYQVLPSSFVSHSWGKFHTLSTFQQWKQNRLCLFVILPI